MRWRRYLVADRPRVAVERDGQWLLVGEGYTDLVTVLDLDQDARAAAIARVAARAPVPGVTVANGCARSPARILSSRPLATAVLHADQTSRRSAATLTRVPRPPRLHVAYSHCQRERDRRQHCVGVDVAQIVAHRLVPAEVSSWSCKGGLNHLKGLIALDRAAQ